MSVDTQISKFLSLVLRHAPEEAGLALDEHGWADLNQLCAVVGQRFGASASDVRRVVEESPKKRFSIDGERIRAVQGHSIDIDLGLVRVQPPDRLFHGTKESFLQAIFREGLTKQSRQHVHLSSDTRTAVVVASRRKGKNAILEVDAMKMAAAGMDFFVSENGVWLTDRVAPEFLRLTEEPAS